MAMHSSAYQAANTNKVDAILAQIGLDGTVRAEQLDVDAMLALSEAVRAEVTD